MSNGEAFLIVDAREPTEVRIVGIQISPHMPRRMRTQVIENLRNGKTAYNNIYFNEGVDGMDGLVADSEDEDRIEGDSANVEEYLEEVLKDTAFHCDPTRYRMKFTISIVEQ